MVENMFYSERNMPVTVKWPSKP